MSSWMSRYSKSSQLFMDRNAVHMTPEKFRLSEARGLARRMATGESVGRIEGRAHN